MSQATCSSPSGGRRPGARVERAAPSGGATGRRRRNSCAGQATDNQHPKGRMEHSYNGLRKSGVSMGLGQRAPPRRKAYGTRTGIRHRNVMRPMLHRILRAPTRAAPARRLEASARRMAAERQVKRASASQARTGRRRGKGAPGSPVAQRARRVRTSERASNRGLDSRIWRAKARCEAGEYELGSPSTSSRARASRRVSDNTPHAQNRSPKARRDRNPAGIAAVRLTTAGRRRCAAAGRHRRPAGPGDPRQRPKRLNAHPPTTPSKTCFGERKSWHVVLAPCRRSRRRQGTQPWPSGPGTGRNLHLKAGQELGRRQVPSPPKALQHALNKLICVRATLAALVVHAAALAVVVATRCYRRPRCSRRCTLSSCCRPRHRPRCYRCSRYRPPRPRCP